MYTRAFIKQYDDRDYLVFIPAFRGYTEGNSFEDAKIMAKDLIQNYRKHHGIPELSIEDCYKIANEDADDDIDFSDGALVRIEVD